MSAFLLLLAAEIVAPSPNEVYRQPQLAVNGQSIGLTFGAANRIYFAISRDEGETWSQPVELPAKGVLSLGMRRGPRIATAGGRFVISAILGEKGRGADGDLMAWSSEDDGQTWSSGRAINSIPGSAREGLHAMAAGGGLVFAAWLDLRDHGTRVFGSVSRDGGRTWSADRLVYASPSGSVCECCHPSVYVSANGRIDVMFRNSIDGARDMYVVTSSDGGQSFGPATKLGAGTWKLNACPMDGGAIAGDLEGLVTVWRRGGEIFLSEGSGLEKRLGVGRQPVIAGQAGEVVAAWTEGSAIRLAKRDGVVHTVEGEAAFLNLIALPGGRLLLTGERQGRIFIERVP